MFFPEKTTPLLPPQLSSSTSLFFFYLFIQKEDFFSRGKRERVVNFLKGGQNKDRQGDISG